MGSAAGSRKIAAVKATNGKPGTEDFVRIVDRMREGALLVDLARHKPLHANEAFYRLSGFTAADLPDLDMARLHDLKDFEWILRNATGPGREAPLLRGATCLGKGDVVFSVDLAVTPLAAGAGTLALLTYGDARPLGPAASREGDGEAARPPEPGAAAPGVALPARPLSPRSRWRSPRPGRARTSAGS